MTPENSEDYCLYVDDNRGEVMWYTKQTNTNPYIAPTTRFQLAEHYKSGIITNRIGWHFFMMTFRSFDSHHSELERTDMEIVFGGDRYFGDANTVDGMFSWYHLKAPGSVYFLE